jgi:hypothetical protein
MQKYFHRAFAAESDELCSAFATAALREIFSWFIFCNMALRVDDIE